MKKVLSILTIITFSFCLLIGCGTNSSNNSTESANTVAEKVQLQFVEAISSETNIENVANQIITNPVFEDISMGVIPVEEGFLNGFNGEITGFDSGVMFAPMIGTIPFVGYIFETNDSTTLTNNLEANAMLNWNICTQADQMLIKTVDNYVLFVMAPNSFDE